MTDNRRVLIVDDTEASRYLVGRMLRGHGFEVLEAGTGQAALEIARSDHPAVVVLDVKLPDIHGFEVAERLKADPETGTIAILHLSASFTAPDARAEGLKRGADAYLTHPVDQDVLCATVDALLRLRLAQQREREARQRAELSDARHRFLAEMVPQLVWTIDAEGGLEYVNPRWEQAMGLTLEQARKTGWIGSVHPDDRERLSALWRRSLATGEDYEIEARQGDQRRGDYRWYLMRALPMRDASGRIERWFGTCTDIEERKRTQAERERLLGELQESARQREALIAQLREQDERKTEFLAILSHELRNPLAPIRNSVHILERAVPGGEQARRAQTVIDRQAEQLTRLVDDLLDVTRISRGKVSLQRERLELVALVRGVAEDLRDVFAAAGIDLSVDLPTTPLYVQGDRTRLAQVVGNLLHNSAKFTRAGGRAEVSLRAERGQAVVSVADDGVGIPPELLERIFEPFVQGDRSLDRTSGGLGLGLPLVKGFVELHGGTVEAASPGLGAGSRFTIRLPLDSGVARAAAAAAEAPGKAPPRRILVIEDNEDSARSLQEVLEIDGHAVEVTFNGAQGLARARELRPDVVLCDIGLPGIDGYAVARALREDPGAGAPLLIALSGYALHEDVERSRAAGFDEHLAKPADPERLLSLVRRVGPHTRADVQR